VIAPDAGRIIGFYALTTAAAARVGLPGVLRRNAPEPVPMLLLGQLAVDLDHQGKGIGRALLRDACLRALSVLEHAGFRALAAHPLDEAAEAFYHRYGFIPIPDTQPPLLVLPVRLLQAAFAAAEQPVELRQRS
jgi:GNAT superfamily N-acetyltransferase